MYNLEAERLETPVLYSLTCEKSISPDPSLPATIINNNSAQQQDSEASADGNSAETKEKTPKNCTSSAMEVDG